MDLNWLLPLELNNETFPPDKLERAKYATFLTKLLAKQGFDEHRAPDEQKQNYVLNLNAEWGAGKTYFLKRWSHEIREHYPVVYIDAWKQDYSDDPLMTVVSSVIEQLREQAGKDKDSSEFKVPKKLIGLLKAAAPGLARGLFKRYVGIDPLEVMSSDDNDNLGVIKGEDGKDVTDEDGKPIDMSFAASEAVKYLIDEHDAKRDAIESLKSSVEEWVEAVIQIKEKKLPAFIFVDELDRCRPNYAVEMLETVKHIFDIKGVVFVIATDTEQLQHAVKALYGNDFNAKVYLSRFFNSRYSLKAPNLENFLEVHSDLSKLSGEYFEKLNIEVLPFNKDAKITLKNISLVLSAFEVSARTAIQISDRVVATIANMPKGSKIDVLMLTALLCIKEKDHELFEKVISGKFEQVLNKGDKTLNLKLDHFLEGYIPKKFHQSTFEINFNPQKIVSTFNTGVLSANDTNHYPVGDYHFQLLNYFKEIFAGHLGSQTRDSAINFFSENRSHVKKSPLEKVSFKLVEQYVQNRVITDGLKTSEITITWIQYLYINNKFNSIDIDKYKDFVELASPLDWMGEDEINGLTNT